MSATADISAFLRSTQALSAGVRQAAAVALKRFSWHVLGQAQQLAPEGGGPFSPRDPEPGRLRDSAHADQVQDDGQAITVLIGFNTEYAAVQHERLDFRHSTGQAKYMETAINANIDLMARFVIDEARKVQP